MNVRVFFLAILFAVAMSAVADGVLQVGNVRTRESSAIVPITLQGDVASGVASMNFQLNYDPNSVRLVSVDAGSAARDSGKQIQWHESSPGRVNVVLSGFNQQTIQSGEVAQLTVEPAQSDVRNARLHIGSSTFASTDGDLIPSQGSTGALAFRIPETDPADDPEEPAPNVPQQPTPDGSGDSGSDPLAPPRVLAGAGTPLPKHEEGASVPASVERRLMAARQDAEALRPLLGASRDSSAPGGTKGAASGSDNDMSRLDTAGSFETTGIEGADNTAPGSTLHTTITPEKKLENADEGGHNNSSSSVVEMRTQAFTVTTVMVIAGAVLFIVLLIYGIRGIR